jgi:hypothetical protein
MTQKCKNLDELDERADVPQATGHPRDGYSRDGDIDEYPSAQGLCFAWEYIYALVAREGEYGS